MKTLTGQPNRFAVAAGSVTGREHVRAGRSNQDGFWVARMRDELVAVVCDGCGSGARSEVGAALGARLVAEALLRGDGDPGRPSYWAAASARVLERIRELAAAMGGDYERTIDDYFLFTVVGLAVRGERLFLFSLGDGLIIVDGARLRLGPFPGDAPPYLAYGLFPGGRGPYGPGELSLRVHLDLPAAAVGSVLLATDGVFELEAGLSEFWTDGRYVDHPDRIRRRLALANRVVTRVDWTAQRLHRSRPTLPDDTTILVARRSQ